MNSLSAVFPAGASPFPTSPFSFKSRYQLSVLPCAFLRVKAKMALPFLMASFRSASSARRASEIRSKAAEDGKASARRWASSQRGYWWIFMLLQPTGFQRHLELFGRGYTVREPPSVLYARERAKLSGFD